MMNIDAYRRLLMQQNAMNQLHNTYVSPQLWGDPLADAKPEKPKLNTKLLLLTEE